MSIGKIMAECDCTHEACAARNYCMANRINELEAKLAEVTAERDEALNQLDSARYSVEVLERRIRELLPRAYRLGLEAGAAVCNRSYGTSIGHVHKAILNLGVPADLAEQCEKGVK